MGDVITKEYIGKH